MLQVLKELDEFINLPVTSSDRLSQYRLLRVKVLATVSSDKTYFPYGRLSYKLFSGHFYTSSFKLVA